MVIRSTNGRRACSHRIISPETPQRRAPMGHPGCEAMRWRKSFTVASLAPAAWGGGLLAQINTGDASRGEQLYGSRLYRLPQIGWRGR